jgi:hypothetical protein
LMFVSEVKLVKVDGIEPVRRLMTRVMDAKRLKAEREGGMGPIREFKPRLRVVKE